MRNDLKIYRQWDNGWRTKKNRIYWNDCLSLYLSVRWKCKITVFDDFDDCLHLVIWLISTWLNEFQLQLNKISCLFFDVIRKMRGGQAIK